MKRIHCFLALSLLGGCSDAGSVDPDAIDGLELAAVQTALGGALANDTLYPTLAVLVFPFVDRASYVVAPSGDTTRLVGIELDIDVTTETGPLIADFTVVLGWTGYDPDTRTVDTVFFVAGAGRAPVNDGLGASFSPDVTGSGTALVIHQAPDSTLTAWQTGTGTLSTSSSSYRSGRTQAGGGLTVTVARGTISGQFNITAANEVPSAATTVTSSRTFTTGARALQVAIRGTF